MASLSIYVDGQNTGLRLCVKTINDLPDDDRFLAGFAEGFVKSFSINVTCEVYDDAGNVVVRLGHPEGYIPTSGGAPTRIKPPF